MAYIEIKDFSNGLDRRRLEISTPANALLECRNAFINRGGDIEKRKAFVEVYDLTGDNTVGLESTVVGLFTFGKDTAPSLPAGIGYIQLVHPDTASLEVRRILDATLFDDLLYVVAEFENGSVHHYYDGTVIAGTSDDRASVGFTITAATPAAGSAASFSFKIQGGNQYGRVIDLRVDGVSIVSGATSAPSASFTSIAEKVVDKINDLTGTSGWSATNSVSTVTVTNTVQSSAPNGKAVTFSTSQLSIGDQTPIAGGVNPAMAKVSSITVDSKELLSGDVVYTTSVNKLATDVAAKINALTTSPDYMAQATGGLVTITAAALGTASNGRALVVTSTNLSVTGATGEVTAGGVDAAEVNQGAVTAATYDSKVYTLTGSLLRFSVTDDATDFTTTASGAGFINLANKGVGHTDYGSVVPYFDNAAIFGKRAIQIWNFVADPAGNARIQTILNTGAIARNSVVNFGDADVFYLDQSGVRSLRARDSVNLNSTGDVGTPINRLIKAKLDTLSDTEIDKIIGFVEPNEGQYWLIMRDIIFVYSFYSESRISAWGVFYPGFTIDEVAEQNRTLYLRSDDDKVYAYGGLEGATYDDSEVYVQTPWLAGEDPGRDKDFSGFDIIDCENEWDIGFATNTTQRGIFEHIGATDLSTTGAGRAAFEAKSTHITLAFTCTKTGPARLASVLVHYQEGEAT